VKGIIRLLLFTLMCCSPSHESQYFEGSRFSFSYPKGWSIEDNKSFVDVTAPLEHPEERGQERLTIVSGTTDGMTLEQCFKTYVLDEYRDQNQGILLGEGNVTINGKAAQWMEYKYGEKSSMTTLVYLIYSSERFFLINTLSSSKRHPDYKVKFEGIVRSFKVK
jgi:hypothetical protein